MSNLGEIILQVSNENGNMETFLKTLETSGFRVYDEFIVSMLALICKCNRINLITSLYVNKIIDFQDLEYFHNNQDNHYPNEFHKIMSRVGKKIDLQTYKEFRKIHDFLRIEHYCIANKLYNQDIIDYCSN
jgi:hypothetical protein